MRHSEEKSIDTTRGALSVRRSRFPFRLLGVGLTVSVGLGIVLWWVTDSVLTGLLTAWLSSPFVILLLGLIVRRN